MLYLYKGHAHIDLLKLIWFPILITDSTLILKKICLIIMELFHLAYPVLSKDKLKTLLSYCAMSQSKLKKEQMNQEVENILSQINEIVVPFYLPLVSDVAGEALSVVVERIRMKMRHEWTQAAYKAITWKLKKSVPKIASKIVQRFTFPWGLMRGIFENFSVNCLFNSDLHYVSHYKNFIHANNEDNTVGYVK